MNKPILPHYDNLIIGFGKGGKTLAAWLARRGEQVAIVERSSEMYGGSCINVACIPTKSLIVSAEQKISYIDAYQVKEDLTSFLRDLNFENIDKLPTATVITGEASFLSPDEIVIKPGNGEPERRISAGRIFINTGSQPFLPPIRGLASTRNVFTSIDLLQQARLPEHLLIIGGGFIGLEFADMYAKFGAEVTILDTAETFLSKEDRDIADEVYKVLTGKRIKIVTSAKIHKVEPAEEQQVRVEYRDANGEVRSLHASAVLIATERKPMTKGLNLEAAGISTNSKGYIDVDELLRTNVPNIWAIGDINGGPQFTYTSLDDFRIIRDQLSGGSYTSVHQRKQYASSVFITQQLAHIGLREKDAMEMGYDIKVAKFPASKVARARIDGNTDGLLKTIVDAGTDKILGCTLFCSGANEMINTIQIAMNCGMDYQSIRDGIYTHPSMTEAFNDLYSLI